MHSTYYDSKGNEVPSVTTILKVLNKPELIGWAHFMGRQHRSIEDILEKSSYFGNCVHDYLECYFNGWDYIAEFPEHINLEDYKKATNNFRWFIKGKEFETIMTEASRSNDLFGGTLDYYGKLDGKKLLIDFKTSKTVYPSYLLQLGGYYDLIRDEVEVEGAGILIVNAKRCLFKEVTLDKLEIYRRLFITLAEFYINYMKEGFIT